MDLACLLEESKVFANHITLNIIKSTGVKVPKDLWKSKLEPEVLWGDYLSDSDHEDIEESCHMYVEIEDIPEAETTSEAPQTIPNVPQSFSLTFTNEDMLEEDGDHNRPLYISSFNQEGQWALGKISLHLVVGDVETTSWFHVIDSKATYNVLLSRAWIHRNNVVPSTLHQCLKYYNDGMKYCKDGIERTIKADENPFTIKEAHFVDAKFYQKKKAAG
ncbi:hypothetical protein LIER_31015 [Lithospermum erythrorhizon]|uniref:Uncharacterized protein n=1 Tax=Lithospermum erythrorhizon TaxID=34254 RepID=A0AAV3RRG5_LITER